MTQQRTAREVAHEHFTYKEGNGCEMVVKALASIGQHLEHSVRCDQDTAFLEADRAETRRLALMEAIDAIHDETGCNHCGDICSDRGHIQARKAVKAIRSLATRPEAGK